MGNGPLAEVDRAFDNLAWGTVAFNTPQALGRGELVEIEFLLSLQKSIERLKRQITKAGQREGARVQVTNVMEARLTGTDFEILAITSERQAVTAGHDTRWTWDVRPTKTGRLRLHLTLTGFLRINGEQEPRAIESFDRVLDVRVTWLARMSTFVGDNWQWLWTALLVPMSLWLLRRRSALGNRSREGAA